MNVYILRHASAGARRVNPLTDRKRGLDKDGKQQCIYIGRMLAAARIHFDLIVSSPLKRALQTAALVGTESGYDGPVQISEALQPEALQASFDRLITSLRGHENILLVGHNPNLPGFLASLIAPSPVANIRMRKGAIARVELTHKPGTLQWLLDPRLLRAAYTSVTKSSRRKISRK